MTELLATIGTVFTAAVGWVGTVATTIAGEPLLLIGCPAAVSLVRRSPAAALLSLLFYSALLPLPLLHMTSIITKTSPPTS